MTKSEGMCGNEFKLERGYFCELLKGHSMAHGALCHNHKFWQSWPNEPVVLPSSPAPTTEESDTGETELCDHGIPLNKTIGCMPCFQASLDGAMDQAESGSAAHIRAGAPFDSCDCVVCRALRESVSGKALGESVSSTPSPTLRPKCDYTGRPSLDASQICRCGTCQLFAKIALAHLPAKCDCCENPVQLPDELCDECKGVPSTPVETSE